MTALPAGAAMLPSPCVGICRLDPGTGWCLGCARDAAELARWGHLTPAAQRLIWDDLPRRKALLGLAFRLLPCSGTALLDHLAALALTPGTGWSIGVEGAVAELAARPGERPRLERAADGLTLRVAGGALRLRPPAGVRLFELVDAVGRSRRLALALHRARLTQAPAHGVTELGLDLQAVDPGRRDERLFDLGVTRTAIRFCVRTGAPELLEALRRAQGRDALDPATGLVPLLLARDPDRVVLSPLGRIEVEGPIARADHAGPHTHLLPALLAQGRVPAPDPHLPEGYVACAATHPAAAAQACRPA